MKMTPYLLSALLATPLFAADVKPSDIKVEINKIEATLMEQGFNKKQSSVMLLLTPPAGTSLILESDKVITAVDGKEKEGQKKTRVKGKVSTFFFKEETKFKQSEPTQYRMQINFDAVPQSNAYYIDDSVELKISAGKNESEKQSIDLSKAGKFTAGGIEFKYNAPKEGAVFFNDDEKEAKKDGIYAIELTYTEDPNFAGFLFYDSKGKELTQHGRSSWSTGKAHNATYQFEEEISTLQISVETYKQPQTIKLPLKMRLIMGGSLIETK